MQVPPHRKASKLAKRVSCEFRGNKRSFPNNSPNRRGGGSKNLKEKNSKGAPPPAS